MHIEEGEFGWRVSEGRFRRAVSLQIGYSPHCTLTYFSHIWQPKLWQGCLWQTEQKCLGVCQVDNCTRGCKQRRSIHQSMFEFSQSMFSISDVAVRQKQSERQTRIIGLMLCITQKTNEPWLVSLTAGFQLRSVMNREQKIHGQPLPSFERPLQHPLSQEGIQHPATRYVAATINTSLITMREYIKLMYRIFRRIRRT